MEPNEKVAELLETAAEVLEKNGWITNEMHNESGFCAVGAIHFALQDQDWDWLNNWEGLEGSMDEWSPEPDKWQLREAACHALAEANGLFKETPMNHWMSPVISWNDGFDEAEPTDRQRILDGFRKAAKYAAGVRDE